MRRAASTLLMAVLCGGAWAGLAGAPSHAPGTVPIIIVDAADQGRTLLLPRGGQLTVRLPAQSASGYRCWLRDAPEPLLTVLAAPAREGQGQEWRIAAVAAGEANVSFECGQELAVSPRRPVVFHVLIR